MPRLPDMENAGRGSRPIDYECSQRLRPTRRAHTRWRVLLSALMAAWLVQAPDVASGESRFDTRYRARSTWNVAPFVGVWVDQSNGAKLEVKGIQPGGVTRFLGDVRTPYYAVEHGLKLEWHYFAEEHVPLSNHVDVQIGFRYRDRGSEWTRWRFVDAQTRDGVRDVDFEYVPWPNGDRAIRFHVRVIGTAEGDSALDAVLDVAVLD